MPKSPKKRQPPESGLQPTSMLIPVPTHQLLKAEATRQDLTVSQLLRRIIQQWFDALTGEPR